MKSIFSEERAVKLVHKVPVQWDIPHIFTHPVKHAAANPNALIESKVWDMARMAVLQGLGYVPTERKFSR